MNTRAENVYEFRRVNFHGQKTGPHADPDYEQKYHPGRDGGTSDKKTGFGLSDGKHKIKVQPASKDAYLPWVDTLPPDQIRWIDVYINPTESQMKRLSDPDATWDVEMRFMVHRETGDLIAWESTTALHSQVTDSLFGMPAWAAENADIADIFSDFIIPAGSFYEGIEKLAEDGYWDYPDRIKPKILRRKK